MGGPTADTCGHVSCLDDARGAGELGRGDSDDSETSAIGGGDPGVVPPAGPLSGSCSGYG